MGKYNELPYTKLKKFCDPRKFDFQSTGDLVHDEEIIGQDRAVKAMEFGLQVKNSQYNIFIVGLKGTGKTSYAHKIISEKAKLENAPDDWCYVYNFTNPSHPIALNVPPGMGKILCEDMDLLVQDLLTEIPKAFDGDDYERKKSEIIKKYQEQRDLLLEKLTEYSKVNGFSMKTTNTGFAFAPLVDGEVVSDKEYAEMEEDKRNEIERNAEEVQLRALEVLRKIKAYERQAKKKIAELDNYIALFVIQPLLDELFDKYKDHEKIMEYLKNVQQDIMDNIYDFDISEDEQREMLANKEEIGFVKKYKVNLFVDNSNAKGAPVIKECNPIYSNLVGRIDYENEQGNLKTDFTLIKPGAIHKANGGYLILQANQVLTSVQSWDTLKRTLENGEISIESLRTQLGIADIANLKPEPIPINVKVVIIGNPHIYRILYTYDEDFHKLFKIKVDFDSEMDVNADNEMKIARFIGAYCEKEGLRHLDPTGVAKVLEYGNRISGNQKKLTTRFNKMIELLVEADVWAAIEGSDVVTGEHIEKTYQEKIYRNNKIEEKFDDMYREGKIIIDMKDRKVGRINGLSVIDLGDHVFGKPSVITVTTYAGSKGIINIEREAEMSGSIHDKGVMILEGYISEKFGQEVPLSLTSKICFEQSYSGVDGDSASSTELYALLSSLSDIPLKQNIAVTGSVNQKGEIQPVGGVTEKIEGFFYLCKYFGFTGEQGVIIPHQNVEDLVLRDEVIAAVKEGKFHIYAISTVEEGMEILTDQPFDKVCSLVQSKLKKYASSERSGDEELVRNNRRLFPKR